MMTLRLVSLLLLTAIISTGLSQTNPTVSDKEIAAALQADIVDTIPLSALNAAADVDEREESVQQDDSDEDENDPDTDLATASRTGQKVPLQEQNMHDSSLPPQSEGQRPVPKPLMPEQHAQGKQEVKPERQTLISSSPNSNSGQDSLGPSPPPQQSGQKAKRESNLPRTNFSRIDEEETKLISQTQKLVLWLRNRLRKRLGDVASLQGELATEKIVLTKLGQSINDTIVERQHEIRLKLRRGKDLAKAKALAADPETRLHVVQKEHAQLEGRLNAAKRTYDALAGVQHSLQGRLRDAGLSHWLEARGSDYLPATAVGVLAHSAELLDPVARGVQRVYALDAEVAAEVESLLPGVQPDGLVGRTVSDLAMLLPLLPALLVAARAARVAARASAASACAVAAASLAAGFALSALLGIVSGGDVLVALAARHGTVAAALAMLVQAILAGLVGAQCHVLGTRPSRAAGLCALFAAGCCWHVWARWFVPIALVRRLGTTPVGELAMAVALFVVAMRNKGLAGVRTPWDEAMEWAGEVGTEWADDTMRAMRGMLGMESTKPIVARPAPSAQDETKDICGTEGNVGELDGDRDGDMNLEVRPVHEAMQGLVHDRGTARGWTGERAGIRDGQTGRMTYGAAWAGARTTRPMTAGEMTTGARLWRGGRSGVSRFGVPRRSMRGSGREESDNESYESCR